MSGVLKPSKRRTIHARDGGICHYCETPVSVELGGPDHIVPKTRKGRDANWNLVWSCRPCNNAKAEALPTCGCDLCSSAFARWLSGDVRTGTTSRRALVRS